MIETERLILRRFSPEDVDEFARILLHPEIARWLGPPGATRDDVARAIERYEAHWEKHDYGRFAVCDRATGDLVGRTGVMHEPRWSASVAKDELGWAIDHRRWGEGLATEAGRAALADALDRVELDEVISFALPENVASIRVMKKLGLARRGFAEWAGREHLWYSVGRQVG